MREGALLSAVVALCCLLAETLAQQSNDSLLAETLGQQSNDSLLAETLAQQSNDSLLAETLGQQSNDSLLAVVQSNNAFSFKLYKELTKSPGNVFFSPLSVEVVLAMAWLGASGETASQIAESLSLPRCRQDVKLGFNSLMTNLQDINGNVTLNIANKIYAQKGFEIRKEFRKSAEQNFLSEAQEVDFQNNTEEAQNTINSWVENRTENRIQGLLAPGSLDEKTVMVLVNALYFKGKWLTPFVNYSRKVPFYTDNNTSTDIQMMNNIDLFSYNEIPELNAKVLQLQYMGEGLSMVILLPNEIEGLADLESELEGVDLTQVVNGSTEREVIVWLPNFKLERTMDLNEPLQKLGMTNMFSNAADFSNLAVRPLTVSKVVQKSFLEVTEEGSEATAASTLEIVDKFGPDQAEFRANHPFIFFIMDNTAGAILFFGRFVHP